MEDNSKIKRVKYKDLLMTAIEKYKKQGRVVTNAHAHIDRAFTLDSIYLDHISTSSIEAESLPLRVKQDLVGDLHRGPAYEKGDLEERMSYSLDEMIKVGTGRVYGCIDTSDDDVGLRAFEIAAKLKESYKDRIDFKLGAYAIFGFKDTAPGRQEKFEESAEKADFMVVLLERDDVKYHPTHIGVVENLKRSINLSVKLGKPIHLHVDQGNDPRENYTEQLVQAAKFLLPNEYKDKSREPLIWAVHVISPSKYDENRFRKLLDDIDEVNLGIISGPSAAVSMRQLRPIKTYTYNSIARILDMLERGITVALGTDNTEDAFVPTGPIDVIDESILAAKLLRFSNPDIWAKVLTRTPLTEMDKQLIRNSLEEDRKVFRTIENSFN